jgi:uncharacterized protein YjbJ (UPF0337 family)
LDRVKPSERGDGKRRNRHGQGPSQGHGQAGFGVIKEAVGKMTGDRKTQAEGTTEKTGGKAQNAVGGAKDAVRYTVKD